MTVLDQLDAECRAWESHEWGAPDLSPAHLRALLDVARAARNISMNTPGAWGGVMAPQQIQDYAAAALAPLLEDTE